MSPLQRPLVAICMFAAGLLVSMTARPAAAVPIGDDCTMIKPVTMPLPYHDTVDLSASGGFANNFSTAPSNAGVDAVWILNTPMPAGTRVVISTAFSNGVNGTVLSVYRMGAPGSGPCSSISPVFRSATATGSNPATISFDHTSGAYLIIMDSGAGGASPGGSAMKLHVYTHFPLTPPIPSPPQGDACSNIISISSLPYSIEGLDLGGYSHDVGNTYPSFPNSGLNTDAIWQLPALPIGTQVTVDTLGSAFPTFLAVTSGSPCAAAPLVATDTFGATLPNQSTITFTTTVATNYYVIVEGVNGSMSYANLHVRTGAAAAGPVLATQPLQQLGLGKVQAGALSFDDKLAVTAGLGGVTLWDTATGQRLRTFPGSATDIDLSPDGKLIACAQGIKTILISVATGEIVRTLTHTGKNGNQFLKFCPFVGYPYVAVGFTREHLVEMYNYNTGALAVTAGDDPSPGVEAKVQSISFSRDGQYLYTGHALVNNPPDSPATRLQGQVVKWDTATGSLITPSAGQSQDIKTLDARNGAGRIAATLGNGVVVIFNSAGMGVMCSVNANATWSSLSQSGSELVAGTTSSVNVYSTAGCNPLPSITVPLTDPAFGTYGLNGGKFLIVQPSVSTASLWTISLPSTATMTQTLSGFTGQMQASAAVSGAINDEVWTGHSDGKATRWSVASGESQQQLGLGANQKYIGISPNGNYAYYIEGVYPGPPPMLGAQNTSDGSMVFAFPVATGYPEVLTDATHYSLNPSADGSRLAYGRLLYVFIWNILAQTSPAGWPLSLTPFGDGNAPYPNCKLVVLSPDGTKVFFDVTNSRDPYTARIYNVDPQSEALRIANFPYGPVNFVSAAWMPDNSKIALGDAYGNVTLINATTGAFVRSYFTDAGAKASALCFSSDGSLLVAGSSIGTIRIFDTATGELLRQYTPDGAGSTNGVESLSFLTGGARIASGHLDGRTFIWELDTPRALFVAAGDPDPTNNALTAQTAALSAYGAEATYRRGYASGDIRILSSFINPPFQIPVDYDGDLSDDADLETTKANLETSILNWTNSGSRFGRRLFLYMTDHGLRESGETHFILNACETISATELDALLDQLQDPAQNGGKKNEVTLVVDCCYSGAFVSACAPSVGQKRTVISSTGEDNLAVFLPAPDLTSFTEQFFGAAFMGASLKTSFNASKSFFQNFSIANQIPELVDEGGAGLGTATGFLGKSWVYAGGGAGFDVLGELGTVGATPGGTLSPGTLVTLTVDVTSTDDPSAIYAQVLPPAPDPSSGDPVTDLPLITFAQVPPGSDHWEATYTVTEQGTYSFGVFGKYTGARRSERSTVFVSVSQPNPEETRPLVGVVVAGQEDAAAQTGPIDDQAMRLTARAYLTARARQYAAANLRTLGPAGLAALGTGIPSAATYANFVGAVNSAVSGQPGAKLFVSLIGPVDSNGDFQFQPGSTITPAQLDALLTGVQTADPNLDAIVLMDCPQAGRYQAALDKPKRYLLLGTTSTGEGFFLPGPTYQSFSRRFLEATRQGRDVYDAFTAGQDFANLFALDPPTLTDGSGNPLAPGAVGKYLGRRGVFASDAGELATICNVAPDQVPTTLALVQVYADFQDGLEPTQVTAQAVPDPPTGLVADAPTVVMTRVSPTSNRWYVPAGQMATLFPANGSYLVSYEASYPTSDLVPRQSQADGSRVAIIDPTLDIYEPAPYFDSLSSTSKNVLTDRAAQTHTLHATGDEDWGIVYQIADATPLPFSLHFELNIPTGSVVQVELYENGPLSPPTQTVSILSSTTERDVQWLGTGLKQIYFRVKLQSGNVTPFTGYRVTFFQNTGANNGIATTIGANSLKAAWSTNSVPAGAQGFELLRSSTGAPGTFTEVTGAPVGVPGTTGACPGNGCADYQDNGLFPLTVYFYQVQLVPQSGGNTPWTGTFYGYTADGAAPSPTPTVTPTATPSRTPSLTPSRTPTVTPSRTPSLTPSRTPTATPSRTPTPSPTASPTSGGTITPSPTASQTASLTPTPSAPPNAASDWAAYE